MLNTINRLENRVLTAAPRTYPLLASFAFVGAVSLFCAFISIYEWTLSQHGMIVAYAAASVLAGSISLLAYLGRFVPTSFYVIFREPFLKSSPLYVRVIGWSSIVTITLICIARYQEMWSLKVESAPGGLNFELYTDDSIPTFVYWCIWIQLMAWFTTGAAYRSRRILKEQNDVETSKEAPLQLENSSVIEKALRLAATKEQVMPYNSIDSAVQIVLLLLCMLMCVYEIYFLCSTVSDLVAVEGETMSDPVLAIIGVLSICVVLFVALFVLATVQIVKKIKSRYALPKSELEV
ncbi:hypothetical protein MRB53_040894 [Persea americana]|nr:hypothetical protein MRB53_040894 [Persea americana]